MLLAVSKDGPDGLLECAGAPDTFSVLGDASRGALYLALRPAASNGESPSPPPPERRALSDLRSGLFDLELRAVRLDLDREGLFLDPVLMPEELALRLGERDDDAVGQL